MSGGSLSMDDPPMRAHHHRYEPRNRGGLAVVFSTADVLPRQYSRESSGEGQDFYFERSSTGDSPS